MARRRTSTAIVRSYPVRSASPIIRVSAPRAPKKHHRRRHGGGGHIGQNTMFQMALGGAAFGFIEKNFGATLPTLPMVGRAGTIAIGAYFLGKGKGGIIRDIAIAGAVIAGYQLGSTGKIAGDDEMHGDLARNISGIASQV